jgi:hypothetical protein
MRISLLTIACLYGCGGVSDLDDSAAVLDREQPELSLPAPTLRRLTRAQYDNAVGALLGDGLILPSKLEPDPSADGLRAIAAALTTISPRGVEQYENAAFDLVRQSLALDRDRLVDCVPEDVADAVCAEATLRTFGGRAWRRPLEAEELDKLVGVVTAAATALDDFDSGLVYGLAAILQSPHFLFRIELGEAESEGSGRRFTNHEMATRLSFLLWNTTPDDPLLAAAEAAQLTDDAGLRAEVDRMMADPRFEDGTRAFFTDMWMLYALDELTKDPTVFTHMSVDVGPSAREETLLGVVDNVVHQDGDYREVFTTRRTFLNRKLASIYSVRAPVREGFAETMLTEEGGRRGFLGQVGFLALHAHPVSSSATLRGKFVREVLLCDYVPAPPANLNTSIPAVSDDAITLRERVAVHLEDEYCASCHQLVDPIGLGFEQFDGLGHFRSQDNGALIDPSGDLDGADFQSAWELADRVAEHEDLPGCLAQTLLAYASGHSVTPGEDASVAFFEEGFVAKDHSIRFLMTDLVMSRAFRSAGGVE